MGLECRLFVRSVMSRLGASATSWKHCESASLIRLDILSDEYADIHIFNYRHNKEWLSA